MHLSPPPLAGARVHRAQRHYRPEIDGLRALAVLPVIFFHAGVPGIPGGFVGVDVFFVISGFLITGIIHREMLNDRFSILVFYERRLRRIVPNLLAMLVVSTIVALAVLIPTDLNRFGQSVIATLTFASNAYFWWRSGYFDPGSAQLPLLHTWSLGVEEQYYLFFPLTLALLSRAGRRIALNAGIWAIALVSFAIALWQVPRMPEAAFYLPFARWWELLIGSLLAIGAVPPIRSLALRNVVALAGFIAILLAVVLYDGGTPFPGLAALAPCLGAAAIIHATGGGETWVGRGLSSWLPRSIGLISYSLYLWHWPVIVFGQYVLQRRFAPFDVAVAIITAFAMALAAFHFIEKPMRKPAITRASLFLVTGTYGAALVAFGIVFAATKGLPQRYQPPVERIAMATQDINPHRADCDSPALDRLARGGACRVGATEKQPTFAIVGDSFGDAMVPAFEAAARQVGRSGLVLTYSGCAMLPGVVSSAHCGSSADAVFALLEHDPTIRQVYLVARWTTSVEGNRYGLLQQDHLWLKDAQTKIQSVEENRRVIQRGIERARQKLGDRQVTLVVGMPEQAVNVPQYLTLRSLYGGRIEGLPRASYDARQATTLALLTDLQHQHGFAMLNLGDWMCNTRECPITDGGKVLYVDDNHPSRTYALSLAGALVAPLSSPGAW